MLSTGMSGAAWLLVAAAVSGPAVRLILGVLTIHATHKALRPTAGSKAADRLRAHRLAVLRALLHSLKPPGR
ncbi:hypothetical protein [Streptomyces sp. TE33382]